MLSSTGTNFKSSYIWETCRSLSECVNEHSKESNNSAIYEHCSTKGHPLPKDDQYKVIDQAKEAIHIQKLHSELNRNVGKMVIPCVFDSLLGVKPKNPSVGLILSQFSKYLYRHNFTLSLIREVDTQIELTYLKQIIKLILNVFLFRHELSNAIYLQLINYQRVIDVLHTSDQIEQVFHTFIKFHRGVIDVFTHLDLLEQTSHTFSGSWSLIRTILLRVKVVFHSSSNWSLFNVHVLHYSSWRLPIGSWN